jgi:RNA-directed DNA polymerase
MHSEIFLSLLAKSLLAGKPAEDFIVSRLTKTLGRNWRWIRPLARRYLERFGSNRRPGRRDVVGFLREDKQLRAATLRYRNEIRVADWLHDPVPMLPVPAAAD